ncbi:hypothetical protein [Stakelama saccharophila]|uniref:Uncharacterized protein n=1 Tax=Stakelama saccharophila TaxID=3075605 RepID=A0ABZ0B610_9SPHN|nr:hypothetical protein [Stakelama sp. W311]WNO52813.1 hypothetical protein RPR59_10115 [Stakelama sp. W311]
MRNAFICVAVMLAVFLSWPFVFGQGAAGVRAAQPKTVTTASVQLAALDPAPPARISLTVPPPAPPRAECARGFRHRIAGCSTGRCRAALATKRDLCDATGNWPR